MLKLVKIIILIATRSVSETRYNIIIILLLQYYILHIIIFIYISK